MENKKVKLIICESTTGIVLDAGLAYFKHDKNIKDQPDFYFDTLEEAKGFIKSLDSRPNVSFEVFDSEGEMIYELHW